MGCGLRHDLSTSLIWCFSITCSECLFGHRTEGNGTIWLIFFLSSYVTIPLSVEHSCTCRSDRSELTSEEVNHDLEGHVSKLVRVSTQLKEPGDPNLDHPQEEVLVHGLNLRHFIIRPNPTVNYTGLDFDVELTLSVVLFIIFLFF